jgi:hypothetical protein
MRGFAFVALMLSTTQVFGLSLAEETIPKGEDTAAKSVTTTVKTQVEAEHKASGKAKRDAHAKAHGCVLGTFKVEATLPANLRKGVFQEGAEYKTWIRFSNGSKNADFEDDARGMALKLTGVPGAKLEADEKGTQDFLNINHHVFFVRNAADYVDFTEAVAKGSPLSFFFPGLNPARWRLHEMRVARAATKKTVDDPLASPYHSGTPYLLGDGQAVRHLILPLACGTVPKLVVDRKSPDFLRSSMRTHLASAPACFEFLVQLQTDPAKMPIEDPTVEWSESRSAPKKVATITIEPQVFESEAQQEFCENLSFNPWHSLPEHRPLGGINRVRRLVYQTISDLRHQLNGAAKTEPTGKETF